MLTRFFYCLLYEWTQSAVGAAIEDKDVGILINNVGISYPFPKYFDELTDVEVREAGGRAGLIRCRRRV